MALSCDIASIYRSKQKRRKFCSEITTYNTDLLSFADTRNERLTPSELGKRNTTGFMGIILLLEPRICPLFNFCVGLMDKKKKNV